MAITLTLYLVHELYDAETYSVDPKQYWEIRFKNRRIDKIVSMSRFVKNVSPIGRILYCPMPEIKQLMIIMPKSEMIFDLSNFSTYQLRQLMDDPQIPFAFPAFKRMKAVLNL